MFRKMIGVVTAVAAALLLVGVAFASGDDSSDVSSSGSNRHHAEFECVVLNERIDTHQPRRPDEYAASTTIPRRVSAWWTRLYQHHHRYDDQHERGRQRNEHEHR